MTQLQKLLEAEMDADDARRAVGAIPEVFRLPGAAGRLGVWAHLRYQ